MSIDGDTPQPIFDALVQVTNSDGTEIFSETRTNTKGQFSLSNVSSNNRVRYSYSDDWGSASSQEKQYFNGTNSEKITLHYRSHSSN